MKHAVLRKFAIATSTIAFAALFTVGWSVESAQARRLYVHPYNHYIADQSGLPWDAVRAYYAGGPWCVGNVWWAGTWGCYSGWDDYAHRNGIGCKPPGSLIKGGDGIMYVCQ